MAKTYLNDALKARKANQTVTQDTEVKLDDISRVKVLSPGRQVFKRFIRNRLAVFGSILLITMFVFSFIGPVFYAYGQKDIFRKYDRQNVNYAMAKEVTAYSKYFLTDEGAVPMEVQNKINSSIKGADKNDMTGMVSRGETERAIFSQNADTNGIDAYQITKLHDDIFLVSPAACELVGTMGSLKVDVAVYNSISKTLTFNDGIEEIKGLEAAAKKGVNTKESNESKMTFELDGVQYFYAKAPAPKQYVIKVVYDGFVPSGDALDESAESVLINQSPTGEVFEIDGEKYALNKLAVKYTGEKYQSIEGFTSNCEVYKLGEASPAMIYSRLTLDTYEQGMKVADDFRPAALLAATGEDHEFTSEGVSYTADFENDILMIRDADGSEFAEMTPFNARRYTGEDSLEFALKQKISEQIEDMQERGVKEDRFNFRLPQQDEEGAYIYEDGVLLYDDAVMDIIQQETDEYVIKADQIIYVIDRFASPSLDHVLGTDGDGFDVLARIMYGGRVSLMVGFVVVFLECFLGIIMGGLAGYYGGWVDMVIMRLVDIFYCLPSMPIMIILGAMMDAQRLGTYTRLMIMMAALGVMGWAGVARMVRGQILSLREQEFMVATEATGIKVRDRIFHHLVPNVMPQLIVIATMGMGGVIITESTLSYLGLGVKHPLATWGTIINSVSSASAMAHYAFIWIPVGLLICLTVIAFNFVGDGLRDAYDPKAKR